MSKGKGASKDAPTKERAVYNRVVMLCHTPNNKREEQYIYCTTIKSSGLSASDVKDLVLNAKERKKKRRLGVYADQRYFQVIAKVEKGISISNLRASIYF